jgi:alcohol dehydrogenase (NADP+)
MTDLPIAKVHHIGVSNFSPHQLQKVISTTGIKPYAHQMELHPYLQQSDWIKSHEDLGISVTAYSPLGNSNPTYRFDTEKKEPPPLLENDLITNIALRRNCTSAQVALAWGFRRGAGRGRGLSIIPKSSHIEHIKENFGAFDCVLEDEDLEAIKSIEKDYVKRFNNPSKGWGVKLFEGLDDA